MDIRSRYLPCPHRARWEGRSQALPSTIPTRRDHAAFLSPSRDSLASFWCLRPSLEGPRWRTSLTALETTAPGSSARALGPGCGRTRGSRAAAPPTPGPAAPAPNPVPALALGRAVTTGLEAAEGGNGPRQGQLWTTLLLSLRESPGPGEVFAASLGLSWTCHRGAQARLLWEASEKVKCQSSGRLGYALMPSAGTRSPSRSCVCHRDGGCVEKLPSCLDGGWAACGPWVAFGLQGLA